MSNTRPEKDLSAQDRADRAKELARINAEQASAHNDMDKFVNDSNAAGEARRKSDEAARNKVNKDALKPQE